MTFCFQLIRLIVLSALFCTLFDGICCLEMSEEVALREILQHHPDLYSVPSWETYNSAIYYGSSWNDSLHSLCQRDGYDYFGVYCKSGHVVGLRVTPSWGNPTNNIYSASSGLSYLSNITSTSRSTGKLLSILSASLPLQHIDTPFESLIHFNDPNTLISLSIYLNQNDTLPPMPNLKSLKLDVEDQYDLDVAPICQSPLTELTFSGNWTQFADLLNCLSNLQRAEFVGFNSNHIFEYGDIISATLRYLSFNVRGEWNAPILVNCSALQELSITAGNATFEIVAPNLKIFRHNSWNLPSSFTSFGNLVDFKWNSGAPSSRLIPNMAFAPNLRSFGLSSLRIANANLSDIWLSLPQDLISLELDSITLQSPGQVTFPSWPSLVSLSLSFSNFGIFNTTRFDHFHSLQELHIDSGLNSMDELYSFPNLQRLRITQSWYPLPTLEFAPDFFSRMNNLVDVDIRGRIAGTIPWYGMENLEVLRLQGDFRSWPSIRGSASQLRHLIISSSHLEMIPTDESFRAANMHNLEFIFLSSTSLTTKPLFWNALPNIEHVYINVPFGSRALPTWIEAPRLQYLTIQSPSCGLLPDFTVTTHLNTLDLNSAELYGPIPQSWEDNLSILELLSLANNNLNGTIPPHLLDHHASGRWYINLENTGFTGPLWNMSSGASGALILRNTGLDVCLQDPDANIDIPTTPCYMSEIPKCPSECPTFWDFCLNSSSVCIPRAFTPLPFEPCEVIEITCPSPRPSEGFECNHGTWIFLGDISDPTISFPPSAGPIVVFGNLSTNGSLTFSGTETSLEIQGCILEPPKQIVIELPSGATPDSVTLITQRGNCSTDLSQIPIVLVSADEGCKKRSVSKVPSPTSLTVIFTLEDQCQIGSSSKKKWIILGATLGGILALLVLVTIVLLKSPGFRTLLRTCSLKKALAVK